MEAYAALVSLMHAINSIPNLPHSRYLVSLNKNQEESLVKNVTFFQEVLEDTSNLRYEENYFERRIAGAANAAQDIIDQLMDAVKSTSHGVNKLYERLNDVVEDMDRIKKEAMETKVKIATVKQKEAGIHDLKISEDFPPRDESLSHSKTRFILPYEELFGREHDTEVLLSKLITIGHSDVQLSVIPIVGGCGIGKTALARMVYEAGSVREHFELRAWVKVEEREFNMKHAAHQILESAIGMQCTLDDPDELNEMVRDTLQSHRCLIVFDGIDSMSKDAWLHMNHCWFDSLNLGSKIVITTQSKDVGVLVAEQSFELKQLSLEDGWSLVKSVALDALSVKDKDLVYACGGIPLSLKLFGSLIRYNDKIRDVLDKNPLSSTAITFYCIWGLPSHLRQCLSYCALFPKGCELNKAKIVDMWISEGLIKPSLKKKSFLEIGNAYFHQLLSRSFFTDITRDPYNDVVGFRIPSLIREKVKDDAGNIFKGKLGLIGSVSEDAAQLSLVSPGEYEWHNMRILIMSPTLYLGGSLDHECSLLEFLELRSLDLSCSGIKSVSDDIRMLRELRYLNLSYTLIESLPDSITHLSSLETLDLSWCYHLKVLPKGLGFLKLMSHLDLSRCESLSSLPSGIDSLVNLSSMPLFVLGKDPGCARLGELGRFYQLQGKLEIRNLENLKKVTETDDPKLYKKRLRHLELQWNRDGDHRSDCFGVLELLRPNQQLEVVHIIGYNGYKFPKWIASINCLIKIVITDCGCDELPSLGQLPFLKELQLKWFPELLRIGEGFYGERNAAADAAFQSLKLLQLYDMPRLFEWSGASIMDAFLSLKSLTIEDCPRLVSLPPFPTLPDLILSNCNEFIFYHLPRFKSLRSLLISSVRDWRWLGLGGINSVKKLILYNVRDKHIEFFLRYGENTMTALEHLGIHHCNELTDLILEDFALLKKLHIVNCQELKLIRIVRKEYRLMELVLEDCPRLYHASFYDEFHSLRKLVVRNCRNLDIDLDDFVRETAEELQYLSISGCPELETQLQNYSGKETHVPCLIVGNQKVNYENTKKESRKAGPGLIVKRRKDLPYYSWIA